MCAPVKRPKAVPRPDIWTGLRQWKWWSRDPEQSGTMCRQKLLLNYHTKAHLQNFTGFSSWTSLCRIGASTINKKVYKKLDEVYVEKNNSFLICTFLIFYNFCPENLQAHLVHINVISIRLKSLISYFALLSNKKPRSRYIFAD